MIGQMPTRAEQRQPTNLDLAGSHETPASRNYQSRRLGHGRFCVSALTMVECVEIGRAVSIVGRILDLRPEPWRELVAAGEQPRDDALDMRQGGFGVLDGVA
jgi:hypothetical protein